MPQACPCGETWRLGANRPRHDCRIPQAKYRARLAARRPNPRIAAGSANRQHAIRSAHWGSVRGPRSWFFPRIARLAIKLVGQRPHTIVDVMRDGGFVDAHALRDLAARKPLD